MWHFFQFSDTLSPADILLFLITLLGDLLGMPENVKWISKKKYLLNPNYVVKLDSLLPKSLKTEFLIEKSSCDTSPLKCHVLFE